jgi:hypothetical protein
MLRNIHFTGTYYAQLWNTFSIYQFLCTVLHQSIYLLLFASRISETRLQYLGYRMQQSECHVGLFVIINTLSPGTPAHTLIVDFLQGSLLSLVGYR